MQGAISYTLLPEAVTMPLASLQLHSLMALGLQQMAKFAGHSYKAELSLSCNVSTSFCILFLLESRELLFDLTL